MEASYEVLGSGSDGHNEGAGSGSASGEELEGEDEQAQQMNGEEVRRKVEGFLKKQMVQTAVSGLGFLMAVVGIWGDGANQIIQSDTLGVTIVHYYIMQPAMQLALLPVNEKGEGCSRLAQPAGAEYVGKLRREMKIGLETGIEAPVAGQSRL
ncbi:hypothetical protein QBC33DRAFT_510931 [Phialemonium atrogriseum]|uniref:Uncharacterized protein n=1 Tax=Phialemonium atrogriseum TaxID=1093897 RepID=A0AAJ0C770_9PEZI|nr:uncharacterized protein QBC33DRAFT_510931 [Phialemonium atrogriseum]KAK1771410.1 hypothetical protein QBC33DRAFT_510931 [Phialemonium atrogriseum]